MKMKKSIKQLLLVVLTLCMFVQVAMPVTTYAASNDSYGWTYDDASTGKTWYKYYSASSLVREYYSKSDYLYRSNGIQVANNLAGSGSRYVGFGTTSSVLYYITKNSALFKVDSNYNVTELLSSGAQKLNYNNADLAITVTTTSGTKSLTTMEDVAPSDDDEDVTPITPASKNRVEMYTNSAGEMVSTAFKNNATKTQIVVSKDGKKVLNVTNNVRLTDTLNGAKFVGFDTDYRVYLTEGSVLYRFVQGSWYQPEKLQLNGTFNTFKRDNNGFISKVVTNKGSYTIKQLTTSDKWKATKTYVVKKSGYQTLYTKGSTKSNVLQLKSGKLYLNGKLVTSSVKSYGFVSSKKFIYITNKAVAYTATIASPKAATKFCTKAKSLKFTSVNLVNKVALTSGKTKKVS